MHDRKLAAWHEPAPHAAQGGRVSAIFARALIEAVEASGARASDFLAQAGSSAQQFASPYGWLELAELDRLIVHAVQVSADPAFGLHWAERSPMMKFDVLAMATAFAPSLRAALGCILRFQTILFERSELALVEREASAFVRLTPSASNELALRVRSELGVCCLVRLMQHVGAPASAVRRVAFAHAAPSYVAEYTRLFGARVQFAQEAAGIEIEAAWLDLPVLHANLELHYVLTSQAQEVLKRLQPAGGHAERLRAFVRSGFPRLPTMREAARAMRMSERSLRRRLSEEGWSYSAILLEGKRALAQRLLADPAHSIKEVAQAVGFDSGPSFFRAFKRWTGETPAAYRSAQRAGASLAAPAMR
jgi:AraC-like DNA-binding protein